MVIGVDGASEVNQKKGCAKDHIAVNNQDLWLQVKTEIRECEKVEPAVLIVDDTLIEKPYSDENDIICWHNNHKTGQSIKGVNLLNGGLYYLYQTKYIPIFAELVAKTEHYTERKKDPKTGLEKQIEKRKSPITKNTPFQNNFNQIMKNHIKISCVLMDLWFSGVENLNFIQGHKQKYIYPLKSNRKLALSQGEKKNGRWYKLEEISNQLDTQQSLPIWLESCNHICYITKQIFNNQDGSNVTMYLITHDQNLTKSQIHTTYELKWKEEELHKSLKSNLSLEKSPTKHKTSQSNHIFYSIMAFFKLELLTKTIVTKHKNHFQIKASLYVKALKTALEELGKLRMLNMGCER